MSNYKIMSKLVTFYHNKTELIIIFLPKKKKKTVIQKLCFLTIVE